jgi:hypothetical protein
MDLSELVEQGWTDHEAATEAVAAELERGVVLIEPSDADGAAAFMNLVNHAIGDHGADRARALTLCEAAFARLTEFGNKAPWLHLAVARHLAGQTEAARLAEQELGDEAVGQVRVRLLVAQGKAHGGDWGEAASLYGGCLHVAQSLKPGHGAERAAAIVSNNLASALLDLEGRDAQQDALMERAAHAARTYWLRVGDWHNDERADYLLARVHNALGRAEEGAQIARRGLSTIAENGGETVDQAFLELALAAACKVTGEEDERSVALLRAQALSDEFEGEGLLRWFEQELAKAR